MKMLVNILSSGQIAGGVYTDAGAKSFNETFMSRFADVSNEVGIKAGVSANEFVSSFGSQSGGAYGAAQYTAYSKAGILTSGVGLNSQFAMLKPEELNVDNEIVKLVAQESGKTPEEIVRLGKEIKNSATLAFNPTARNAVGRAESERAKRDNYLAMSPEDQKTFEGSVLSEQQISDLQKRAVIEQAAIRGDKLSNKDIDARVAAQFSETGAMPRAQQGNQAAMDLVNEYNPTLNTNQSGPKSRMLVIEEPELKSETEDETIAAGSGFINADTAAEKLAKSLDSLSRSHK